MREGGREGAFSSLFSPFKCGWILLYGMVWHGMVQADAPQTNKQLNKQTNYPPPPPTPHKSKRNRHLKQEYDVDALPDISARPELLHLLHPKVQQVCKNFPVQVNNKRHKWLSWLVGWLAGWLVGYVHKRHKREEKGRGGVWCGLVATPFVLRNATTTPSHHNIPPNNFTNTITPSHHTTGNRPPHHPIKPPALPSPLPRIIPSHHPITTPTLATTGRRNRHAARLPAPGVRCPPRQGPGQPRLSLEGEPPHGGAAERPGRWGWGWWAGGGVSVLI